MADERVLAGVRRFWSADQVSTNYEIIVNAAFSRLQKVTVITGKGTEGDNATAQVVIESKDYPEFMAVMEARLLELEAEARGETGGPSETTHANFGNRFLTT